VRDGRVPRRPLLVRRQRRQPGRALLSRLLGAAARQRHPFRLHWGKHQPIYGRGDREWVDFFRSHYPRWDDFLALRAQRDPNNIFLTGYWRDRLGLWDEPEPSRALGPPRQ
jgi:hypothetical protein